MKAAICTKYGKPDLIEIRKIKKPSPKDNEILIHIITATVQTGDFKMLNLPAVDYNPVLKFLMRLMMGYNKPKKAIFGTELFGKIESIGKKVTKHKVGDEIIVMTDTEMGAHTEYLAWPQGKLIINKPERITPEQAAAVSFGGTTALYFLKKANIQKEQTVLIYGASGTVGTSAVQISKYFGAIVTGVCGSKNIELVKSIGADYAFDYTKENIGNKNAQYDIIFDAVGKISKKDCRNILKQNGKYVSVLNGLVMGKQADLDLLKKIIEQNKYLPVIDRCYKLDEIIEAYKYVGKGHKSGNIIINV
jgi:NADPH:quinone reductase-like Zn-dependent oxidoreductase